jgi:PIN domain nuclease of toxin-antitoxin system
MVSVLTSSVVDRGFISGVMVSVLTSSVVDRGFISGVMVSVLTSSVVDRGFKPRSVQSKELEFFTSAKLAALRRKSQKKTGWLGIRIMCLSEAACLSVDCCFIETIKIQLSVLV